MKSASSYDIVRKTQIALYKNSGIESSDFTGLIELISPENMADFLDLSFKIVDVIPGANPNYEVAGMLDRTNRTIWISRQFPNEQCRLTGMHEIVHWMLHGHIGRDVLHRDRPITDQPQQGSVPYHEWEATNVACQLLMPEKMVTNKFAELFGLSRGEPIEFNEDVAFHLNMDIEQLRRFSIKQRAMLLATTRSFGRPITPLHQLFKISPTAMAIRLQELELIAPDRRRGTPNLRIVR
jgi:hypothetical protein